MSTTEVMILLAITNLLLMIIFKKTKNTVKVERKLAKIDFFHQSKPEFTLHVSPKRTYNIYQ